MDARKLPTSNAGSSKGAPVSTSSSSKSNGAQSPRPTTSLGKSATSSVPLRPANGKAAATSASKPSSKPPAVVVSTIRRKLPSVPSSSLSNGSRPKPIAAAPPKTTNALPAEVRARIEAARAAEREREIEREAEAQVIRRAAKKKTEKPAKAAKRNRSDDISDSDEETSHRKSSARKPKRKEVDDLFGSDEDSVSTTGSSRKASKRSTPLPKASSSVYTFMGRSGVKQPYLVPRPELSADQTVAWPDGENSGPLSSAQLVEQAMAKSSNRGRSWGPFFRDFPMSNPPRCRLEYPSAGASEDFLLLVSKDTDDYDPISDLLRSVYVMVKYYVPEDKRSIFGELDELETASAAGHIWTPPKITTDGDASPAVLNGSETPIPGTPTYLTPGTPSKSGFFNGVSAATASPAAVGLASGSNTPLHVPDTPSGQVPELSSILRSFTKSRNRRSGQLFLNTVERFNEALSTLRESGALRASIEAMASTGVAEDVWSRIQDQAYARTVAPRVDELASYRSFSDNVYGELTPRFMSEIAQLCNLTPSSVMVDLGCGVGNLVIQTALQVGCESYGIEMMPTPAELGVQQTVETSKRWKMWGVQGGQMKVWKGDFLEDESVREHMRRADVVIVNNYAFTPPLNESLSLLFLDLPDSCHIVSLKPFVPPDFRLTDRTVGSPSAILAVQEREYGKGMVSWTERGGKYYIASVDRKAVGTFLEGRFGNGNGHGRANGDGNGDGNGNGSVKSVKEEASAIEQAKSIQG